MITLNDADAVWARYPALPREHVDTRVAAVILEIEHQRDSAQHDLDKLRAREPGRYAFYHRHLALAHVRQVNPELHQEAFSVACQAIDARGGRSYQDVVTGLEEAADLAVRGFRRWRRNQKRGGNRSEADHGLDDLSQAISDLDALLRPAPEEASAT